MQKRKTQSNISRIQVLHSILFALPVFLALVFSLSFTSCKSSQKSSAKEGQGTLYKDKTFAAWFSYIDYSELCGGMNKKEFTAFAKDCASSLKKAGFNTIYIHAVSFTDAFYNSSIYPASSYAPGKITSAKKTSSKDEGGITTGVGFGIGIGSGGWRRTGVNVSIGMSGRAGNYPQEDESSNLPSLEYDPLQIMCSWMKKNGISCHAWINPLRSVKDSELSLLPDNFIVKRWAKAKNGRAVLYKERWYLNPYYPEVRNLVCSVAQELLENYEIDGIHLDDYFYPEDAPDEFDEGEFAAASKSHPGLTLQQFRVVNTDVLVRQLYKTVKKKGSSYAFGISPAGNINYCRNRVFSDPAHWAKQGTVDYIIPQVYWGFLHPSLPYEKALADFTEAVKGSDVELLAGLAAYKTGTLQNLSNYPEADAEWLENTDILARQTKYALERGLKGIAAFRYASLFAPVTDTAPAELENLSALIKK